MWNLVYLQLLMEEQGIEVINLGPCVPVTETLQTLVSSQADALIISSVNGHGFWQGRALREAAVRAYGEDLPPFLIGGKLATNEADNVAIARKLRSAGFAEVFVGADAIPEFRHWLASFKRAFALRSGVSPPNVTANEATL
jgi:methylmalonyl-CoA mutase cobalamin-binding subunit